MTLYELTAIIMPRLSKVLKRISDDKLISISVDEAWDNGILLTFARYNTIDYDMNDTYQMRAIIGRDRIIYENAVNGVDERDFIVEDNRTDLDKAFDDYYGVNEIFIDEYDEIMNL